MSTSDPIIGRTFGPYRVVGPLGKGGMGEVYVAPQSPRAASAAGREGGANCQRRCRSARGGAHTRNCTLVRNGGFTADGSEIWLSAISGGDQMRLVPLTGGALRPFQSTRAFNVAWSPDGTRTVFHANEPGEGVAPMLDISEEFA